VAVAGVAVGDHHDLPGAAHPEVDGGVRDVPALRAARGGERTWPGLRDPTRTKDARVRPEVHVPSIRRADAEDAAALAAFAEATFRATFGAENAAEDMDLHCRGRFGAPLQAAEVADPTMVTLLSESNGELVGFAQLRWGEAPACVVAERPVEIQRLYVDGAWHGKGVAQALMASLFEQMARANSDVAWLGVWERNARAIAYYRRTGFVEVGDHVFELGSDPHRSYMERVGRWMGPRRWRGACPHALA
jgi:diamine N-acetyltransferase